MKKSGVYVVRFSEFKDEKESFNYLLDKKFFNTYENPEWEGGEVDVELNVLRRIDGFTFDLVMKGNIEVHCDRCLDLFQYQIFVEQRVFLKFGEEVKDLDADIIVIQRDVNELNLGQMFYDYLVLAIPLKKIHPDLEDRKTGCNLEMIHKLEQYIVPEGNVNTDPRWDDLKKLIDKN